MKILVVILGIILSIGVFFLIMKLWAKWCLDLLAEIIAGTIETINEETKKEER